MTYNFFNLNSMMSGFPMFNGASLLGINSGYSNAYTGMQVANIFAGVLGQVTNAYQAEKTAEKQADLDMDNEYKNIDDQISSTLKEIGSGYDEHNYTTATLDSKYDTTISEKQTTANDATNTYNTEENYLKENKSKYNEIKAKSVTERTKDDKDFIEDYDKRNNKLSTLKAAQENANRELQAAKDAKIQAQRKLDANIRKVTELLAKRAKLENQINNRDLDKLSKKVKKGSDDDLTNKLTKNGEVIDTQTYTVTDFNTAVHRLMISTRGSEERYKNAQLVSDIYKKLPETDKNSRLKKCAEIAEEEIRKHKKPDNETQGA